MGPNNIVLGWRDDKTIVFRSRGTSFNDFIGQLYLVSIDGGLPEQLPLPRGGWCSYSPDGKQLAYNRVFREFRTWKRYRGGMADDIWIYDFADKTTTNLTNNPAGDVFPMWHGDEIYFLSDRDENKRMNLFVVRPEDEGHPPADPLQGFRRQVPVAGRRGDRLRERRIHLPLRPRRRSRPTRCPFTFTRTWRPAGADWKDVGKEVTSYDISPDGQRAVFGARGDVFTVPAKYGNTRNLTQTSGVHERNAVWSPDGKWIAYVSDATGEDEIYIMPQDGSGPATQLTRGGDTYKYRPASGRPTASGSSGPTRSSGSSTSTCSRRRSRWWCRPRPGRSTISAGRPTASGSPTPSPKTGRCRGSSCSRWPTRRRWPVTDEWFASQRAGLQRRRQVSVLRLAPQLSPGRRASATTRTTPLRHRQDLLRHPGQGHRSPLAPKSDEVQLGQNEKKADEPADRDGKKGKPPAEDARRRSR